MNSHNKNWAENGSRGHVFDFWPNLRPKSWELRGKAGNSGEKAPVPRKNEVAPCPGEMGLNPVRKTAFSAFCPIAEPSVRGNDLGCRRPPLASPKTNVFAILGPKTIILGKTTTLCQKWRKRGSTNHLCNLDICSKYPDMAWHSIYD